MSKLGSKIIVRQSYCIEIYTNVKVLNVLKKKFNNRLSFNIENLNTNWREFNNNKTLTKNKIGAQIDFEIMFISANYKFN